MFLTWEEIWFQIVGPQTEKARFPNWVRVLTTTAALVAAERSCRCPDSSLLNLTNVHVAEICRKLMKNSVHRGGDLELNSCLHRQLVKTLQRRLDVCPVIQSKNKMSGHVLHTLQRCQSGCRKPVQHGVTISNVTNCFSHYTSQMSQPSQIKKKTSACSFTDQWLSLT